MDDTSDDEFRAASELARANYREAQERIFLDYVRQIVRASGATLKVPAAVEERVAAYLTGRVDAITREQVPASTVTVRSVGAAVQIPHATVGRTAAWKEFAAWRARTKTGSVWGTELTATILAHVPDRSVQNPCDIAAENEIREMSGDERELLLAELEREQREELAREQRPTRRRRN